jgi:hypothetical protein
MVDPPLGIREPSMRIAGVLLVALACATAQAANAPFVQIAGPGAGLADTCGTRTTPATIKLNLDLPAGSSWSYAIGYVMPDSDNMYMMDMMMMGMTAGDVYVAGSAPQNGPLAASDAPLSIGSPTTWFGPQGARLPNNELVVTATVYSGLNGTGQAVASTRMTWRCSDGAVMTVADAMNSLGGLPASDAKQQAVEFYNASLDHYFMTTDAKEIADLDSGAKAGWTRTGQSFGVFAGPAAGTDAVCRVYMPPGSGDSHFYSASASECSTVRTRFPTFVFESSNVFYIARPDANTGACPSFTVPVYRFWNGRADSNHRYTTDPAIAAQMMNRGYVPEGYGPNAVIMCAAA